MAMEAAVLPAEGAEPPIAAPMAAAVSPAAVLAWEAAMLTAEGADQTIHPTMAAAVLPEERPSRVEWPSPVRPAAATGRPSVGVLRCLCGAGRRSGAASAPVDSIPRGG